MYFSVKTELFLIHLRSFPMNCYIFVCLDIDYLMFPISNLIYKYSYCTYSTICLFSYLSYPICVSFGYFMSGFLYFLTELNTASNYCF